MTRLLVKTTIRILYYICINVCDMCVTVTVFKAILIHMHDIHYALLK